VGGWSNQKRVFPAATLCRPASADLVRIRQMPRDSAFEKYFDEATKTVKPYLDAGKVKSFLANS